MIRAKLTDRMTQVRFFRFVIVGAVTALVQFAVLAVVRNFWKAQIAFTAAFVVATAAHYCMNRLWALPSARRDNLRQLGEYVLTVVISYLINLVIFTLAHSYVGLGVMWAAVCAIPPATLAVFLLLNFRVFRAKN